MRFEKLPKTLDEQLDLLQSRGMVIEDRVAARHYLSHLNYYRLTAYWLPFEADHASHAFKSSATFRSVLNLYVFDRELRLLVLDAIERVEVSLRTQWAYHLAHEYGAHAYLNPVIARKRDWWRSNLDSLRDEIKRADEVFIEHYQTTYTDPPTPPIWAVCEIMSLGLLSRWFTNLKPKHTRSAIAAVYRMDEGVLEAFIRHMTYIRNVCAHHSRLWNRRLTVTMKLPRTKPSELVSSFNAYEPRLAYNTLVMLAWFLDCISPDHLWKTRLRDLLRPHTIDEALMGFPKDYEGRFIWRESSERAGT
jgi:abortive infection bacteriophage resistance protein